MSRPMSRLISRRPTMKQAAVQLLGLALGLALATQASAQETLVVHLPSSPLEGAARQAAAVDALASYLTTEVDGLQLETQLFRRMADADQFVGSSPHAVLVLSESAWAPNLAERGLEPAFRLRRGGEDTYRRVVVVPAAADAQSLGDLRGTSLTVVDITTANDAYIQQAVFGGEVDPAEWFDSVQSEADDYAAVNAVLFGRSEAALVAEFNPLLERSVSQGELRVVYRSPPLPLPVLSWRPGALSQPVRDALIRAMASLATGRADLVAELGIDGFARVEGGEGSRLARLPEAANKRFEITAPDGGALRLPPPEPPPADALTYRLAIELPKVDVEGGGR